jgi:transcriptional adapter 3
MRAQPRSRNTTPSAMPATASLPPIETVDTETLDLRFEVFRNLVFDDLVDNGLPGSLIPDSRSLDGIASRLQQLSEIVEKRGTYCDRGMRLIAQSRSRARIDEMAVDRRGDEQKEGDEDSHAARKANKKKRKAQENVTPKGKTGTFGLVSFLALRITQTNEGRTERLRLGYPHYFILTIILIVFFAWLLCTWT